MLILEDELQRILLVGNANIGHFVTGVVLALLGHEDDSGKFVVEDICPADMPTVQPEKKLTPTNRSILFMSSHSCLLNAFCNLGTLPLSLV